MTGTSKSSALKFVNIIWVQISSQSCISGVSQFLLTNRYNYVSHFIFITIKKLHMPQFEWIIPNIAQSIKMLKTKSC